MILEALAGLDIGPNDLAAVLVTHIHLDHAGGVGDVAAAFPSAVVYVHEHGARHLVDPERLIASAAQVYGGLIDSLYGRLAPTPEDRVHVLYDGDTVDLGDGRTLTAIDSPGHAKHHLGFVDSQSGILFAGDAVGVKLPGGGALRPATPPPDFDLEQALNSLRRFAAASPTRIALAHYGIVPTDPEVLLDEAAETLTHWAEEAERLCRRRGHRRCVDEAFRRGPIGSRGGPACAARDLERDPLERGGPATVADEASGTAAERSCLNSAPAPTGLIL